MTRSRDSNGDAPGEGGTARDLRPYVYAVLDAFFAALYFVIARTLPTSDGGFQLGSYALSAVTALAAVGTASRRPFGWWLAVGGAACLLLGALALVTLLVASAAFLYGVYGDYGKAAGMTTFALAALAVALYALLPSFQLRYLLSRAGRHALGRVPPR